MNGDDLRAAARSAYSGWNGWHHEWHWPRDYRVARVIQREAVQAAHDMRQKIEHLKAKIRECEIVAGLAAEYAEDMEGVEHE